MRQRSIQIKVSITYQQKRELSIIYEKTQRH